MTQETSTGTTETIPRSDAELQNIRDLVSAAVGLDLSRGDEITVKSLPFAALSEAGTRVDRSDGFMDRLDVNSLIRLALMGMFMLAVIMVVMRIINKKPAINSSPSDAALLDATLPLPQGALPALPMLNPLDQDVDVQGPSVPEDDPVDRLKRLMKERHNESLKLLSGWIDKNETIA